MISLTQKKCTKCGELKDNDFINFPKDASVKNTRTSSWCRKCYAKNTKRSRQIKEITTHPFRVLKRLENLIKFPEFPKVKLTDEERELKNYIRRRDYFQNNKERIYKTIHIHRDKNRDLLAIRRHVARANKYGVENTLTLEEWLTIKNKYNNKCLCCSIEKPIIIIDHILPVSKGGTNTLDNIQPLCESCNKKKKDKYIDFRPY